MPSGRLSSYGPVVRDTSGLLLLTAALVAAMTASALAADVTLEERLAVALEASGQVERAHTEFVRLRRTGVRSGVTLAGLVRTALATGRTADALTLAAEVEQASDLGQLERLALLADLAIEEKNAHRLERVANELAPYATEESAAAAVLGRVLLALNRSGAATATLEAAYRRWPDEVDLALLLAQLQITKKKPADAVATLSPWLSRKLGPAQRRALLEAAAFAGLASGKARPARAWIAELLASGNRSVEILELSAQIDLSTGRLRAALATSRELGAMRPRDAGPIRLEIDALERMGDRPAIAAALRRALGLEPGSRDLRRALVSTLGDLGRWGEATREAGPLGAPGAPLADVRIAAWAVLQGAGKPAAIPYFERLAAVPSPPAADLETLCELYLDSGRMESALDAARRWRQTVPKQSRPAVLTYQILEKLGRRAESVAALQEALGLELEPGERQQLSLDHFYALHRMGRDRESAAAGLELLGRFPGNDELRRSLAFLLSDLGRRPEACEIYRPMALRPGAGRDRRLEYVELLLAARRRAEAVRQLEELLPGEPADGPAHSRLVEIWAARGADRARAARLARRMEGPGRRPGRAFESVARAWIALGRPRDSRALLDGEWRRIGPRTAPILRLTATQMLAESRWKEALDTLRRYPWPNSGMLERRFAETQAWLVSPPELRPAVCAVLDGVAASRLATSPDAVRELGRLRLQATRPRVNGTWRHRQTSDQLLDRSTAVRAEAVQDGRWAVEAEAERIDLARRGDRVEGELLSVKASRAATGGMAVWGALQAAAGIPGAGEPAWQIGILGTPGRHGDSVRLETGVEFLRESPLAWQRGLAARTVRLSHERPRAGGAIATHLSGFHQRIDDGVARWGLAATGRWLPHPRGTASLTFEARDASGVPARPDLYFAPRDYASLDLETAWRAASLGSWGDWTVRVGRHFDRVEGGPARGIFGGVRTEFTLGDERALSIEWTRLTNSANRVIGVPVEYQEQGWTVQYTGRF